MLIPRIFSAKPPILKYRRRYIHTIRRTPPSIHLHTPPNRHLRINIQNPPLDTYSLENPAKCQQPIHSPPQKHRIANASFLPSRPIFPSLPKHHKKYKTNENTMFMEHRSLPQRALVRCVSASSRLLESRLLSRSRWRRASFR